MFLATTLVRISFLIECLSLKLHWLPHSLSLPTTCMNLTGWCHTTENLHPYSSPYKPHIRTPGFLFGFLTLEDETDRLSRNVGRKSLHNNPEECSSLLLYQFASKDQNMWNNIQCKKCFLLKRQFVHTLYMYVGF